MNKKALTEADIRTKFITPALVGANGDKWNVMTQIREEAYFTKGRVVVRGKTVMRGEAKKADYILSYRPNLPRHRREPPFRRRFRTHQPRGPLMLQTATAIRFDKSVSSGKTKPGVFVCGLADGSEVELIVKFAGGCEMRERALATEAIAAMMAADLDLPVPEPFVVVLEPGFVDHIPDLAIRERAKGLPIPAFGSKKLPPGYSTIVDGRAVPTALVQTAAEILAFDTFIVNPDRTAANPNCLTNGRAFAIYDHELASSPRGSSAGDHHGRPEALFSRRPWRPIGGTSSWSSFAGRN